MVARQVIFTINIFLALRTHYNEQERHFNNNLIRSVIAIFRSNDTKKKLDTN